MDIIFIGQYVSFDDSFANKNHSQASNLFQNKFLRFTRPSLAISVIPIFVNEETTFDYPDYPTQFIYHRITKNQNNFQKVLRILKDSIKAIKLALYAKSKDVWFYNLNLSTFLIALYLMLLSRKRLFIIIADYETVAKDSIIHIIIDKLIQGFNGAIVLNSNIIHKNKIVLPGILDINNIHLSKNGVLKKRFLLSGSLGKTAGFDVVLEYFSKRQDLILTITGRPYEYNENEFNELLKRYVEPNSNIVYLGLLSYEHYYQILDSVDIALSFRDPLDSQHDYNFPSKILEYLSFSKIVISTKRYPDIDSNLYFFTEIDELAIDQCISSIFSLSENDILEKRKFIYNYLNNNFTQDALLKAIQKISK